MPGFAVGLIPLAPRLSPLPCLSPAAEHLLDREDGDGPQMKGGDLRLHLAPIADDHDRAMTGIDPPPSDPPHVRSRYGLDSRDVGVEVVVGQAVDELVAHAARDLGVRLEPRGVSERGVISGSLELRRRGSSRMASSSLKNSVSAGPVLSV